MTAVVASDCRDSAETQKAHYALHQHVLRVAMGVVSFMEVAVQPTIPVARLTTLGSLLQNSRCLWSLNHHVSSPFARQHRGGYDVSLQGSDGVGVTFDKPEKSPLAAASRPWQNSGANGQRKREKGEGQTMPTRTERWAELTRLAGERDTAGLLRIWHEVKKTPAGQIPDRFVGATCHDLLREIIDAEFPEDGSPNHEPR